MEQWLTVTEFAKLAGVTTQAIYKKTQTGLKPYTKQRNGKKFISSKGLVLFEKQDDFKLPNIASNETNQQEPTEPTEQITICTISETEYNRLKQLEQAHKAEIKALRDEMAENEDQLRHELERAEAALKQAQSDLVIAENQADNYKTRLEVQIEQIDDLRHSRDYLEGRCNILDMQLQTITTAATNGSTNPADTAQTVETNNTADTINPNAEQKSFWTRFKYAFTGHF